MYANKSSRIVKLIIQETGTYEQQYSRPYNSNLDYSTQKQIIDSVENVVSIPASALAGIANQFIRPAATPEGLVNIPNGWDTKRLRFLLEIATEDHIGNKNSEYIVGYTDHVGLSHLSTIDPNMPFYINAVNCTRTVSMQTALGTQKVQMLKDASHILSNDNYAGYNGFSPNKFAMRPEDIFNKMGSIELENTLDEGYVDLSARLTGLPIKSKRTNSIVPVYVSGLLDSWLQARRADSDTSSEIIREAARQTVKSEQIGSDPFMSWLRSKNNMAAVNYFTLNDLLSYDHNLLNVTHVVKAQGYSGAIGTHQKGSTAHWGGADMSTLFATQLSQAVPGYMLQYTINKIYLFSTNLDISGNIVTKVSYAHSFNDGVDISANISTLVFRLETELLKGLSLNNSMSFSLELLCDLLGETWIKLSINGEPEIDFVCPSFCDSLLVPVVTMNEVVCSTIASDFDGIMTQIDDSKIGQTASMSGII